jgi:WD40 repeat protein
MSNLLALATGTELVGDYRIRRVLGAGGFGITYLADELALTRLVTIKEYFPADFAARSKRDDAAPRSKDCAADYKWGLDRFIEEAQTLARFEHPNIVRVFRYFRANNTGYMVLQFEEGKSLKTWLRELGRAPRQGELDQIVAPLLDALEMIHRSDFLHRDIAPDNIIIRKDKSPVLIDFGSARGEIASQSRTVSALVKPGYSPYEQYATTSSQQGAWTDIYALGATLYQAVTGKRPPDAPSRVVQDEYVSARDAAVGSFRPGFLAAIDKALKIEVRDRPQSIADWRGPLLAPVERPAAAAASPAKPKLGMNLGLGIGRGKASPAKSDGDTAVVTAPAAEAKAAKPAKAATAKAKPAPEVQAKPAAASSPQPNRLMDRLEGREPAPSAHARVGLGYGPTPQTMRAPHAAVAESVAQAPQVAATEQPAVKPVPRPIRRPKQPLWSRALFFLRPPWRGLLFKFGVGLGVASLAVSYQNQPSPSLPVMPAPVRTASQQVPSSATVPAGETRPSANVFVMQPVLQLPSHKGAVLSLASVQSGRRIASVGSDGIMNLSESETGQLSRTVQLMPASLPVATPMVAPMMGAGAVTSVSFQGGQFITVHGDGTVAVWDLERGDRIAATRRLDGSVSVVAALTDSDRLAVGGTDGHVALLDRKSGGSSPLTSNESHSEPIRAIASIAGRNMVLSASDDKTVKAWNSESLSLIRTYRGHNGPVTALDTAPDGKAMASGASDGQIRLWSTASNRLIRTVRAHGQRISALGYAPSGDMLASGSDDGTVKLWDTRRGRLLATIDAKSASVRSLMFVADGRRLVTAGDDGAVRVWDVSTIRIVQE